MQDLFAAGEALDGLRGFGKLLLAIRQSVGNKDTALTDVEMLKAVGIRDAEAVLSGEGPLPPSLPT